MDTPFGCVRLKEGLNIQALMRGEDQQLVVDEEDVGFIDIPDFERSIDSCFEYEDYIHHVNLDVTQDQVEGLSKTPFEVLGSEMTNVTPDGKIKKRLIEPGTDPIPNDAMVYVNYDFYLEMEEIPIDSSLLRLGKPERLQLGKGCQILGFEIAINSMAVGEKSHFLIHYDYAFLKRGVPSRIPPEADIYAVIQVVDAVDCGLALEERQLTPEERKSYAAVSPHAEAEHNLANNYFKVGKVAGALNHYKIEENLLINCSGSESEEMERKDRLFKIYLNMSICYNHKKSKAYEKALHALGMAIKIDRERALGSAKFFYNRAVARDATGHHRLADVDFKKALLIEPNNPEISARRAASMAKFEKARKAELQMCVKTFGGMTSAKPPTNSNNSKQASGCTASTDAADSEDGRRSADLKMNPDDWDLYMPELPLDEEMVKNNLFVIQEKFGELARTVKEQHDEARKTMSKNDLEVEPKVSVLKAAMAESLEGEESLPDETEPTPQDGTPVAVLLDDLTFDDDSDEELTKVSKQKMLSADSGTKQTFHFESQKTVCYGAGRPVTPTVERLALLPSTADAGLDTSLVERVTEFLDEFVEGPAVFCNLGYGFTPAERAVYKQECERLGLLYEENNSGHLRLEILIKKHL